MLPMQGKPLLAYILQNIAKYSINHIAINIHFKPDIIKNYFGNGSKLGVNLTYFHEPELLGTAGGLKNMEDFLRTSENFLVIYGDILTNQDLNLLIEKQLRSKSIGTL